MSDSADEPIIPSSVAPPKPQSTAESSVPAVPKRAPVPRPAQPQGPPTSAARPAPPAPGRPAALPGPIAAPVGARGPAPARSAPPASPAKKPPAKPSAKTPNGTGEEEVEESEPFKFTVANTAPWMVSTGFHMLVVLVMALFFLPIYEKKDVELTVSYAEDEGIQDLVDLEPTGLDIPEDEKTEIAEIGPVVDDPLASPMTVDIEPGGVSAVSPLMTANIGFALDGRQDGSAKNILLGKFGGTKKTEDSVKLGLEWLKRQQRQDGTWSLRGPYDDASSFENVVSATAMALLAFQGAGNTPEKGEYKDVVARGWKALLALQDKEGFFEQSEGSFHHKLYAQGQAMIAVCELYGMTKNKKYKDAAELAVQYAQRIQAEEGGWRYQPGEDADLSVTGWWLMGLQSARMGGLKVRQETLDNVTKFLDSCQDKGGDRYCYQPIKKEFTHTMTAEGLLCRQYLGWERSDPRLLKGVEFFTKRFPLEYAEGSTNVYYWYYATQVLHHIGGKPWDDWNKVMREELPNAQIRDGRNAGSWNAAGDEWGSQGGRLFVTCLSLYNLEVYYRHMPLYGLD